MRNLLLPRPTGALRLLFRLPVWLFRLHLGWLLGHRGLLLVHRGRKSGRVYQTVLEVVRYDPAIRENIVLSGWGERADWYRNIMANPALQVRTGHERFVPEQRFLAPEENHAVISDYAQRHPLAFGFFARVFGYPLRGTDAARQEFASSVRVVAFRPKGHRQAMMSATLEGRGLGPLYTLLTKIRYFGLYAEVQVARRLSLKKGRETRKERHALGLH